MTNYSEYDTAEGHSQKGTKTQSMGNVKGYVTKSFTFEVTIDPLDSEFDYQGADEFLITVNGKVVKRMTPFQAERMGLLR